jgi:hypothetical protein
MSGMTSILVELGWQWRLIRGRGLSHLVPAQPGPLSRTACNRFAVVAADLEEPVGGQLRRCSGCLGRERA